MTINKAFIKVFNKACDKTMNNTKNNTQRFKLGLIINPYAGIGGAQALKGSDGKAVREQALAAGAEQLAMHKTALALNELEGVFDGTHDSTLDDSLKLDKAQLTIYTAEGDMGASVARACGFEVNIVYSPNHTQTEASDTEQLATALKHADVDLILFAGGDGTARNIYTAIGSSIPVLGIPAGCKIHSGVYAITPRAAGKVLRQVVSGELVSLLEGEVKDINEEKFRQGQVVAQYFGEMLVPEELNYIQAVKMGGKESDELVLNDIAAHIMELMEDYPNDIFIMGSGSTVDAIMQTAGFENTLLGVDIVYKQEVIAKDVSAKQLLATCADYKTHDNQIRLVITLIGGQGHIFGRGNQQLSPEFIALLVKENIHIVAAKTKLNALGQKGLIADTGSTKLDRALSGPIPVITGYKDKVLYFVRREEE